MGGPNDFALLACGDSMRRWNTGSVFAEFWVGATVAKR
jgi:hypothetical protein